MSTFRDEPTYVPLGGEAAEKEAALAKARESLWKAVNELSEEHRMVILLRQQADLSFVDIAEKMERSPGDVRLLWVQAILKLGGKLSAAE